MDPKDIHFSHKQGECPEYILEGKRYFVDEVEVSGSWKFALYEESVVPEMHTVQPEDLEDCLDSVSKGFRNIYRNGSRTLYGSPMHEAVYDHEDGLLSIKRKPRKVTVYYDKQRDCIKEAQELISTEIKAIHGEQMEIGG